MLLTALVASVSLEYMYLSVKDEGDSASKNFLQEVVLIAATAKLYNNIRFIFFVLVIKTMTLKMLRLNPV